MDDWLFSTPFAEEEIASTRIESEILEKGEFGLTKWMSIDERVIAAVPERDRAKSFVSASLRNVVSERVLVVE